MRQVTQGDRQLDTVSVSSNGAVMAYTSNDAVTPADVFVSKGDGSAEQRLTSFNDAWLTSR